LEEEVAVRGRVFFALLLVLLIACAGCGDSGGESRVNRTAGDISSPLPLPDLTAPTLYSASFGEVEVSLEIPATGEEAEQLRSLMSRYPNYLLGSFNVNNGTDAEARYFDYTPVLVFEDGFEDVGDCTVELETDRIGPGENIEQIYQFSRTSLDGLSEVLIRSGTEGEKAATPPSGSM
jgi:hypothetical protein